MKRKIFCRVAIAFLALVIMPFIGASMANAEPGADAPDNAFKPVLELFTSQGCSSCPPADEFLGQIQSREDVVALTLPVDYWDYLGWADTLARPENAVRQRLYAKKSGAGTIYTPQIVVNGVTHAVGSRPNEVEQAINRARDHLSKRSVSVKIALDGKKVIIDTGAATSPKKPATIWIASLTREQSVMIKRGENHGRTVSYFNVVRGLKKVGEWDGTAKRISFSPGEWMERNGDGCAVLIQEGTAGPIIGAAIMRPVGS